ncbi:MAG: hypothetical protein EPN79_10820 [Burkholderiaceae bacterium]|nr:MAG: hypothetical protein EPN79_10820 [Burkholderiaceae bacterium]TBR76822.1 MAG: hypothetical protein EPN64_06255 [Burkholderiaceae bacterium]
MKNQTPVYTPSSSVYWVEDAIDSTESGSTVTHSYHDFGKVRLWRKVFQPGPLAVWAYGKDHPCSSLRTTYSLWTGLSDVFKAQLSDQNPEAISRQLKYQFSNHFPQLAHHVGPATFDETSGRIWADFKQDDLALAISFALSLEEEVSKHNIVLDDDASVRTQGPGTDCCQEHQEPAESAP